MYLGILATLAGDHERAEAWFEQALALNTRMGAASWVEHTRYHRARMLLARDGPGDRTEARRALDEIERSAEALGLARLSRLVGEALAAR
jgi:tetratricopeptide (TPR) repeat protein